MNILNDELLSWEQRPFKEANAILAPIEQYLNDYKCQQWTNGRNIVQGYTRIQVQTVTKERKEGRGNPCIRLFSVARVKDFQLGTSQRGVFS